MRAVGAQAGEGRKGGAALAPPKGGRVAAHQPTGGGGGDAGGHGADWVMGRSRSGAARSYIYGSQFLEAGRAQLRIELQPVLLQIARGEANKTAKLVLTCPGEERAQCANLVGG